MGELELLREEIRKCREEIAALRQQLVFDSSRVAPPNLWPSIPAQPWIVPTVPGWPYTTCGAALDVTDQSIWLYNDAGQA